MNHHDLARLQQMLADVEWKPEEQRIIDQAVCELRANRDNAKPTVQTLFGPQGDPARVDDLALHFVIPTPPSKKNMQALRVIPGGKQGLGIPVRYNTHELDATIAAIQATAVAALKRQAPQFYADRRPLLIDEDAAAEMVHNVHNETLDVLIRRAGPAPRKGVRSGRRCDVHNLPEIVLDAIQRIAFNNDNQVVDLRVWRNVGTPTTAGDP